VAFSFGDIVLPNAKKLIGKININLLEDLTQVGSITLTTTDKKNLLIVSLGDKTKFDLSKLFKAIKVLALFINKNKNIIELDLIHEDSLAKLLKLTNSNLAEQVLFNLFNNLYHFD